MSVPTSKDQPPPPGQAAHQQPQPPVPPAAQTAMESLGLTSSQVVPASIPVIQTAPVAGLTVSGGGGTTASGAVDWMSPSVTAPPPLLVSTQVPHQGNWYMRLNRSFCQLLPLIALGKLQLHSLQLRDILETAYKTSSHHVTIMCVS